MQPNIKPNSAADGEPPDSARQTESQRIGELEQQLNDLIEISSDFYFETDEQHRFTILRGPDKWKWPQGRTDHWGVSARDDKRIHAAERAYQWA